METRLKMRVGRSGLGRVEQVLDIDLGNADSSSRESCDLLHAERTWPGLLMGKVDAVADP